MQEPVIARRDDTGASHLKGEKSRCLLGGAQTGGLFSLIESTMEPGAAPAPLHVHSREDELFYVVEGRITAHAGDRTEDLGPGDSVFLPRGIPHRVQAAGTANVRVVMLIAPAGLEPFFDEAAALAAGGDPDPAALAGLAARYGVTILAPAGG